MNYKWYLFVLQSLVKVTSNFLGIIVIKPLTIDKINKIYTLDNFYGSAQIIMYLYYYNARLQL